MDLAGPWYSFLFLLDHNICNLREDPPIELKIAVQLPLLLGKCLADVSGAVVDDGPAVVGDGGGDVFVKPVIGLGRRFESLVFDRCLTITRVVLADDVLRCGDPERDQAEDIVQLLILIASRKRIPRAGRRRPERRSRPAARSRVWGPAAHTVRGGKR